MTRKTVSSARRSMVSLRVSEPTGQSEPLVDRQSSAAASQERITKDISPETFTQPFIDFLADNPTVFHAVSYFAERLSSAGFVQLSERDIWNKKLEKGGKYWVERNGSSLIAFEVGSKYESGNGVGVIAGHIDALTAKRSVFTHPDMDVVADMLAVKPIPTLGTKAGYKQLGVGPYAGGLNNTWFDRDLGVGGRVLVKNAKSGKIETKLVKLDWPIARIPTLAPHFGSAASGPFNLETEMVPIIGLDQSSGSSATSEPTVDNIVGGEGTFAPTQPPRLVKAISKELGVEEGAIVNWELELFDTQPGQVGGIDKEFIFAGRIDDKLCSYSAIEGLIASDSGDSGSINAVALFDDEEIGSQLRQGARGNFLSTVVERIAEVFADGISSSNVISQTYANSFLVSADVTHAVNPNFLGSYLENHSPQLNVGVVVSADPNGHMTTDAISMAILQRVAERSGSKLQLFQIRNDSRSGGTVGPMLSSQTGMRAIDAGIPQLSMHSIRATCGSLDPGLGVKLFKGFFDHFEEVDREFA